MLPLKFDNNNDNNQQQQQQRGMIGRTFIVLLVPSGMPHDSFNQLDFLRRRMCRPDAVVIHGRGRSQTERQGFD